MSKLNPDIPSPELSHLLTTAASQMDEYKLRLLTPQLLLRTILNDSKSTAHLLLQRLAKQRGFDWSDLSQRVEMMARHTAGRDAKFTFSDDFGVEIPLAEEMLVVLDEALTIAQAREELQAGSGHALAAMAQPNVTTFAVLQRIGVTAAAVIALLDDVTASGKPALRDIIQEAKEGKAQPVYERKLLISEAMNILALSGQRHMIFVGPEGAGKRTLAYSLAQLLAAGSGPTNIRSFVQVNETALLDNPLAAMENGSPARY